MSSSTSNDKYKKARNPNDDNVSDYEFYRDLRGKGGDPITAKNKPLTSITGK